MRPVSGITFPRNLSVCASHLAQIGDERKLLLTQIFEAKSGFRLRRRRERNFNYRTL